MDNSYLKIGLTGCIETKVFQKDTALFYGSGNVDVYATPAMISLIEKAALSAVELHLPIGMATVGTVVNVNHIAATPLGMRIKAKAELVGIDGRNLVFKVEVHDEVEKVGEGYHQRCIVDVKRFREKVYSKCL